MPGKKSSWNTRASFATQFLCNPQTDDVLSMLPQHQSAQRFFMHGDEVARFSSCCCAYKQFTCFAPLL
jgi:hypothetical protein